MTNKTQTEVTMQVSTNSIGNDVLHYNGFKIDYQIACDSCDCCGTRHELTWDAYNPDINEHVFDACSLQELIQKIDNKEFYVR